VNLGASQIKLFPIGFLVPITGALLLVVLQIYGCQSKEEASPMQTAVPGSTEIVIAAVGDVMMPESIQNAVVRNGFSYNFLFDPLERDLSADMAFANLETTIDHTVPASGYPRFNARPELLEALKQANISIVSVANNHILDAGPDGLIRTLENIESAGMRFTGAGRTIAEAEQPTTLRAKGISVAFLAYTYGTNKGLPKKKRCLPSVNILRANSEQDLARAEASVRKARTASDIVIVSLHWSDEYRTTPTDWQRQAAAALIEAGADVVLGHHPHVLQPIESYTSRSGRRGLIAFSLGNFISSQNYGVSNENRSHTRALRGDGIILKLYTQKKNNIASVTRAEFLPIWNFREKVGTGAVFRPISIAREIERISSKGTRTREEEDTLSLLQYRQAIIADQLTVNPVKKKPQGLQR
jgi:poly-gamma-glutamate capsule biosynthesis protein CapA/YwtB (metallophosphatase superfamily)